MRWARISSQAITLVCAAGLGVGTARAAGLDADYGISLIGLPMGTAQVKSSFDGGRYKLELQMRLSGVANLVTSGGGAATATGSIASAKPTPASFALTSRSGNEQRTVRMGLTNGNVAAIDIAPPLEDKADRVPLSEAHKRGIVDPVSALVMPAVSSGPLLDPANCDRTIPVFDGAARFDVVLSYAGTQRVEKPAYRGPVLVCNARYVAIAGHRAQRPATKFMEDNREMSVWLAPLEGARLLVPLRIAVQTMVGMSVIEATRWSIDGAQIVPTSGRRLRNSKAE